MVSGKTAREAVAAVRLYLITDARPSAQPLETFLESAIAGGVGMVQLRDRTLDDADLLRVAIRCADVCRRRGVPLIVNDRADIAVLSGAHGVHLGQGDIAPAEARRIVGADAIVGLSTHSPSQVDAAQAEPVDYIGVGPIHATPTKLGRPPVGTALVRYAAARSSLPFFAIGGIDPTNAGDVAAAGARAVSALRFLTEAADPEAAARALIAALGSDRSL